VPRNGYFVPWSFEAESHGAGRFFIRPLHGDFDFDRLEVHGDLHSRSIETWTGDEKSSETGIFPFPET
jgi:hypothetical protein